MEQCVLFPEVFELCVEGFLFRFELLVVALELGLIETTLFLELLGDSGAVVPEDAVGGFPLVVTEISFRKVDHIHLACQDPVDKGVLLVAPDPVCAHLHRKKMPILTTMDLRMAFLVPPTTQLPTDHAPPNLLLLPTVLTLQSILLPHTQSTVYRGFSGLYILPILQIVNA